jgi:hypothetical protein
MKKTLMIHLMMALVVGPIFSEKPHELIKETPEQEEAPAMIEMPMIQAGDASVGSTKAAQSISWQNWVVAGGALIAAAVGVVIVATNSGSAADHD